jgi:hypothetical protein
MSRLDDLKPTGYDGLYKTEFQVEGEWVSMALLSKGAIIKVTDYIDSLCDEDVMDTNSQIERGDNDGKN